jgi:hypothetical protein
VAGLAGIYFTGIGPVLDAPQFLANHDTTTGAFVTDSTSPEFGLESQLINIHSNPIFTDTSTQVLSSYGGLAGNAVRHYGRHLLVPDVAAALIPCRRSGPIDPLSFLGF